MNYSLAPLPEPLMSVVSSYLEQDEAIAFNRIYPGTLFGERTHLEVTLDSIEAISCELARTESTKKITSLKISIPDFSIEKLVILVKKFNSLDHLDFDAQDLTDLTLQAVAENCPDLRHLDVSRCSKLTNRGIQDIAKRCHSLRFLGIAGCTTVTNQAVKDVVENCPDLEYLDIAECDKLTDRVIQVVASRCLRLRYLNFAGCFRLTNRAFRAIAENCLHLEYLDASWCNQLTDRGIRAVVNCCIYLRYLDVRGCNKITNQAFQDISDQYPNLELFWDKVPQPADTGI